jgi:isoamylase
VTAIELLPVHDFLDDKHLVDHGLRNYWGYNTINFFSPTARYSGSGDAGGQVTEFKEMVKALHGAGIEVILDVVYNHTGEGSELGPTLSLRGLDNPTYYRLLDDDPRYYKDYTGTGNSLNVRHPQVLKLIMDSLRYWVLEMHVDGFRFDLAAALARELHEVDRLSGFFDIIHQDPILSRVKLIAEPWDVGEGGYQIGNFPVLWVEWNGKYRDAIRRYWRGDESQVSELAYRLTGSSDLYQSDGRRPYASINFVTAHDGFTLHDLVSYNEKHNEANGEDNQDGGHENFSWNCGVEGPTEDPAIIDLRERQKRNFLATLLLSQGVPMISGGDEIGRTQQGNNNAYCQDKELSWYDWNLHDRRRALLAFTKRLIQIRCDHPALNRRKFFAGRRIHGSDIKDITWVRPDGAEMTDEEWETGWVKALGLRLAGDAIGDVDENGEPVSDDTLLILMNSGHEKVSFVLPSSRPGIAWKLLMDTARPDVPPGRDVVTGGETIKVRDRSLILFTRMEVDDEGGGGKSLP